MSDHKGAKAPIPLPPEKISEIKPLPGKDFLKYFARDCYAAEEVSDAKTQLPRGIWWGVAGLLVFFVVGLQSLSISSSAMFRRRSLPVPPSSAPASPSGECGPQAATRSSLPLRRAPTISAPWQNNSDFFFRVGPEQFQLLWMRHAIHGLSQEFAALEMMRSSCSMAVPLPLQRT